MQHIKVANVGFSLNNVWQWCLSWRGLVDQQSIEEANILHTILKDFTLVRGKDDSWSWILDSSKLFTMCSCYNYLMQV